MPHWARLRLGDLQYALTVRPQAQKRGTCGKKCSCQTAAQGNQRPCTKFPFPAGQHAVKRQRSHHIGLQLGTLVSTADVGTSALKRGPKQGQKYLKFPGSTLDTALRSSESTHPKPAGDGQESKKLPERRAMRRNQMHACDWENVLSASSHGSQSAQSHICTNPSGSSPWPCSIANFKTCCEATP